MCFSSSDQTQRGPSYAIPADDSPHDSSDDEDQFIHLLHSQVPNPRKRHTMFIGAPQRECSHHEIQVKYFSRACYEGFPSLQDALTAWDIAIASKAIGPPSAGVPRRRCSNLEPSTPPRSLNTIPPLGPISMPSHRGSSTLAWPLRGSSSISTLPASQTITCTSPTCSRHAPAMTSPPSTPVRPAARDNGSALTPSSPSSLSVDPPATPSSHGSAACLSSITAALEGLNMDAYYIVIRGRNPGIYTIWLHLQQPAVTYMGYVAWLELESSPTQCL
ncbi:uncharacterized protein LACBIDRAFT_317393 [Laccaria bicolor S238N-H82]|uniref:Predicted protein n=1 Tax=Laccaria bicolor (strain S238N-H82 / ATCC MYA-4686) TaxID=486041 RepID=B0D532_LACBS|nr:uncharacterized protein LACBIDRAFT_317393 [Laccaria bicolor S238N-H82]EDR10664.1 predicted protein [Laccaria bicolor S238N-H82]|eukprot:XP_001879114.1 predicted protein [Laccaria bicolor S238N-H82]